MTVWRNARCGVFIGGRCKRGRILWISLQPQPADVVELAVVGDDRRSAGQGQALDVTWLWCIAADGDRYAAVEQDVGAFLRVTGNEAVEQEAVIDVADQGDLRPAVGSIRGNRHDPVAIEELQDEILGLQFPDALAVSR